MDANTLDQGFVAAVRRLLGWLVVLGCAAILLPCLLVAGIDASAHGEEWDGLGLFLAAVVGIPAVTALVLQTLALRLESRRPLVSRVLTVVVALGLGAVGVVMTAAVNGWAVLLVLTGALELLTAFGPAEHPGRAT